MLKPSNHYLWAVDKNDEQYRFYYQLPNNPPKRGEEEYSLTIYANSPEDALKKGIARLKWWIGTNPYIAGRIEINTF